ncbi:MAG TPA: phage/plasmid primase, P4 family [Rhizomicrobium sp.]|jgi:P4 family phage/plasmid primase-like protien|nr:phage/plasmid primase, P4 family [Rhizomicrobium sp.]
MTAQKESPPVLAASEGAERSLSSPKLDGANSGPGSSGPQSPNADEAIAFLRLAYPAGPWALTAIFPEKTARKKAETRTFSPETEAAARAWIDKWNGNRNLYWSVNPPLSAITDKAKREDIKAVCYLHVDVDPWAGEPLEEEHKRIAALFGPRLPAGAPPPTCVIFSGGGYQGFWKLREPLAIDGDVARAEDAKRYNIRLEQLFGGDHCHDVSRVMRLPGSWNLPDEKKRKKGRQPALARVVEWHDDRVYDLSQFSQAPADAASGKAPAVDVPADVPRLASVDELDKWSVPARVKVVIVQGRDPDSPKEGDNSRSAWLFDVCCQLVRCGVPDATIYAVITDAGFGISESVLEVRGNARKYALRQIEKAKAAAEKHTPAEDDDKPTFLKLAGGLLANRGSRLIRYNAEWLSYCGGAYRPREDEGVRAEVYRRYSKASRNVVTNILDATKGLVHLDRNAATPPCWLDGATGTDPAQLLVLRNGILNLATGEHLPHSDALFTRNALDFDFEPRAPRPERWLQFLAEVWPEETDCRDALQQMFGYLLTPDTSQQKIFVLVGPTRCGKGTIGRVLGGLLGRHNVCSPTLSAMGENFGLQCMIGRQVALVSDMRMGNRTDKAAVAEALLRISGEDAVSVPRKNMTDWEGRLGVRFVIMSNEAPTLNDPSGALLARYIVLQMRQTFLGREDRTLDGNLAAELPGILNWSIDGWRRLRAEGRLEQPASAGDLIHSMGRMAAPISAFVEDECEIDPEGYVSKDTLYSRFKAWCREQDRLWYGSKDTFGKELTQTCGYVRSSKAREGGSRQPVYRGIKLPSMPF